MDSHKTTAKCCSRAGCLLVPPQLQDLPYTLLHRVRCQNHVVPLGYPTYQGPCSNGDPKEDYTGNKIPDRILDIMAYVIQELPKTCCSSQ